MITEEAKAEVFWLAFKGLPKKEQQLVVQKLLQDREFVEDLMDIALIEQRRSEPSRPLEEVAEKELEDLPREVAALNLLTSKMMRGKNEH